VSPNRLRPSEQSAQAVAPPAPVLAPAQLSGIVMAVDDYMVGYTLRELAAGDGGARKVALRFREQWEQPWIRHLLDGGEFPMLSQSLTLDEPPPSLSFEDGLDWLLDGFASKHGL
jgi:hypothetical protein